MMVLCQFRSNSNHIISSQEKMKKQSRLLIVMIYLKINYKELTRAAQPELEPPAERVLS